MRRFFAGLHARKAVEMGMKVFIIIVICLGFIILGIAVWRAVRGILVP